MSDCSGVFNFRQSEKDHYFSVHQKIVQYCSGCSRPFRRRAGFYRHRGDYAACAGAQLVDQVPGPSAVVSIAGSATPLFSVRVSVEGSSQEAAVALESELEPVFEDAAAGDIGDAVLPIDGKYVRCFYVGFLLILCFLDAVASLLAVVGHVEIAARTDPIANVFAYSAELRDAEMRLRAVCEDASFHVGLLKLAKDLCAELDVSDDHYVVDDE